MVASHRNTLPEAQGTVVKKRVITQGKQIEATEVKIRSIK